MTELSRVPGTQTCGAGKTRGPSAGGCRHPLRAAGFPCGGAQARLPAPLGPPAGHRRGARPHPMWAGTVLPKFQPLSHREPLQTARLAGARGLGCSCASHARGRRGGAGRTVRYAGRHVRTADGAAAGTATRKRPRATGRDKRAHRLAFRGGSGPHAGAPAPQPQTPARPLPTPRPGLCPGPWGPHADTSEQTQRQQRRGPRPAAWGTWEGGRPGRTEIQGLLQATAPDRHPGPRRQPLQFFILQSQDSFPQESK